MVTPVEQAYGPAYHPGTLSRGRTRHGWKKEITLIATLRYKKTEKVQFRERELEKV